MIDNAQEAKRYTTLALRLQEAYSPGESSSGYSALSAAGDSGEAEAAGGTESFGFEDFDPDDPFAGWDD